MKKSNFFVFLLSIFVLFHPLAFGQNKTDVTKASAESKKSKWNPTVGTFEFFDKLPKHYEGTSAKLIIDWINSRVPEKKGEYEKQTEYDEKKQLVEDELSGKIYAFKVPKTSFDMKYEKYDADLERFIPHKYGSIRDGFKIDTDSKHSDLGKYSGSNAYGKTVQVSKFYTETYGVYVDNSLLQKSGLFYKEQYSGYKFSENLHVPIEKAKLIDAGSIGFLFVGEIESINLKRDSVCLSPKIDSPFDGCSVSKNLRLKVHKIITYNYNTGEILSQVNLTQYGFEKGKL